MNADQTESKWSIIESAMASSNIDDVDVVELTLKLMDPEQVQALARQQLSKTLSDAIGKPDTIKEALRRLFHKAQSYLPEGVAQDFNSMLMDRFDIDARRTKWTNGPRRKVSDFLNNRRFDNALQERQAKGFKRGPQI
jgi:hypothetical protein